MNSKRWSFSCLCLALTLCAGTGADASTTKVGNGDDGSDLEGATPITGGIILETRAMALANLKALNVQGIAGLGQLIPELQHSQLLMAKSNVRALSSEGVWETSEDGAQVFARTFPEPHAPTRFFPAAKGLSRDQLIALHTHEALHRALPPEFRENETKVAILTMAITSPSANFDRISLIAKSELQVPERLDAKATSRSEALATSKATVAEAPITLPKPTQAQVVLSHTSSSNLKTTGYWTSVERMSTSFSPLGVVPLWNHAAEPRLLLEGLLVRDPAYGGGFHVGPLSMTMTLPTLLENGAKLGPLMQVSLKSIEEPYSSRHIDRDVYTIGGFYENQRPGSYSIASLNYTLAGTGKSVFRPPHNYPVESTQGLGPIWSLKLFEGFKAKRFHLGGAFEMHHASTSERSNDTFTILRAGPELKIIFSRVQISMSAAFKLNRSERTLDELGDLAGHGSGKHSVSAALGFNL